jgi:hypothetical protein
MTFHEFAASSIQHSEWARAYYEHQRNDKKKSHHVAVRSLAFKWQRIIYRCWKDRANLSNGCSAQKSRECYRMLRNASGLLVPQHAGFHVEVVWNQMLVRRSESSRTQNHRETSTNVYSRAGQQGRQQGSFLGGFLVWRVGHAGNRRKYQ